MKTRTIDDPIKGLIHKEILYHVWEEKFPDKKFIEVPATWWDSFKIRWFPKWLLSEHPPEIIKYDLSLSVTYPEFNPAVPDHVTNYRLHEHRSCGWEIG